ncbi:MAG: hypothetical protein AAB874_06785 [Patescibacteria group bacterium]
MVPGIDLRYQFTNNLVTEEFILKNREAAKLIGSDITQQLDTVNTKVVTTDQEAFGFYDNQNREIFRFGSPFAKDADGVVINDITLNLEQNIIGYKLAKKFNQTLHN